MKDVCEGRTEKVACSGRQSSTGASMLPDEGTCTSRVMVGSNLETLLPKLKSISEEQAWALCYLCSVFLLESNPPVQHELTFTNVYIKSNGIVFISNVEHNDDNNQPSNEAESLDEDQIILSLGCLVYNALDYGLDEDTERQLSPEIQELVERLTADPDADEDEEDGEEERSSCIRSPDGSESSFVWPPGPTNARHLLSVCEFRIDCSGDRLPITHYQDQCQRLIYEADMMSLYQRESKSFLSDLDFLEKSPMDLVRLWRDVSREVIAGVDLKPAKQIKSLGAVQADVLRQLRVAGLRKKLKHVEATVAQRTDMLKEIKMGKQLKPASERVLSTRKEVKTPLEKLMDDISCTESPVRLRPVPDEHKRHRDKPAPDTNTILFRALRRAETDLQQADLSSPMFLEECQPQRSQSARRIVNNKRKHTPMRRHMRHALESSLLRAPSPLLSTLPTCGNRDNLTKPLLDFKGFTGISLSPSAPTLSHSEPKLNREFEEPLRLSLSSKVDTSTPLGEQRSDIDTPPLSFSVPLGQLNSEGSSGTSSPLYRQNVSTGQATPSSASSVGVFKNTDEEDLARALQNSRLQFSDEGTRAFPAVQSRRQSLRKQENASASPRLGKDRRGSRRSNRLKSSNSCMSISPCAMAGDNSRSFATERQRVAYDGVASRQSPAGSAGDSGRNSPVLPTRRISTTTFSVTRPAEDAAEPECRTGDIHVGVEDRSLLSPPPPPSDLLRSSSSATPLLMTGGLSYSEIVSIRSVQTDLDLECMENTDLASRMKAGKVCFACQKKKFTFFGYWAARQCILCKRKVCQDCITKVVLLDVDFSKSNVASDLENMKPIEACDGCRVSLLTIARQGPKILAAKALRRR